MTNPEKMIAGATRRRRAATIGLAAMFVALAAAAAGATALAPHRALYVMELISAAPGRGIGSVRGEMYVDAQRDCDGWTLEHRLVLDVALQRGSLRMMSSVSSRESIDGRRYRFSLRNQANGRELERLTGDATLDGPGKGGLAVFRSPNATRRALPPGTLFPMQHNRRLLDDAEAGRTLSSASVFDGATEDGALPVSAVIGKPRIATGDLPPALETLRGLRFWPIRIAYFDPTSNAEEPQQEVGLNLFENGIGDEIVFDFKDFKVRARLSRLAMSALPDCG
jgi:EipB-like